MLNDLLRPPTVAMLRGTFEVDSLARSGVETTRRMNIVSHTFNEELDTRYLKL